MIAALTMGLLGTIHCAAMCGPLAVAGCSSAGCIDRRATLAYLSGRFVAYAFAGALMGHLGRHAACVVPTRAFHWLAVALVAGFSAWRAWRLLVRPPAPSPLGRLGAPAPLVRVRRSPPRARWWAALLPRRGLGLGLVTGFLPCGLLLPAWALAAASGGAAPGALVMLVFAAASAPGLLAAVVAARAPRAAALARRLPPRVWGLAWAALAVWVVLRPILLDRGVCH